MVEFSCSLNSTTDIFVKNYHLPKHVSGCFVFTMLTSRTTDTTSEYLILNTATFSASARRIGNNPGKAHVFLSCLAKSDGKFA